MKKKYTLFGAGAIIVFAVIIVIVLLRPKDDIVVGILLGTINTARWAKDVELIQSAVEAAGHTSIHSFMGENYAVYIPTLERMVEKQGVDVIIYIPSSSETDIGVVERAKELGIPVVDYDRLIQNAPVSHYTTHDTFSVGVLSTQETLRRAPSGKYIYVRGDPKDSNTAAHKDGVFSVLQPQIDAGRINLVDEFVTENWETKNSEPMLRAALTEHPDVVAVICGNDTIARMALGVAEELGISIVAGGQDADIASMKLILADKQAFTVYKPLITLAQESVRIALALAQGKTPETDRTVENGFGSIPATILPVELVTKENIDKPIDDGLWKASEIY